MTRLFLLLWNTAAMWRLWQRQNIWASSRWYICHFAVFSLLKPDGCHICHITSSMFIKVWHTVHCQLWQAKRQPGNVVGGTPKQCTKLQPPAFCQAPGAFWSVRIWRYVWEDYSNRWIDTHIISHHPTSSDSQWQLILLLSFLSFNWYEVWATMLCLVSCLFSTGSTYHISEQCRECSDAPAFFCQKMSSELMQHSWTWKGQHRTCANQETSGTNLSALH